MGVLEVEIRSISKVQGIESHDRESERAKVKFLRSDNGGEYISSEFKE